MAILNQDVIQKMAEERARTIQNKRDEQTRYVWNKLTCILAHNANAIDIADTFEALYKGGFASSIEDFEKGGSIHFNRMKRSFDVRDSNCTISYIPADNTVQFSWSGCGMCECYDSHRHKQDGRESILAYNVFSKRRTYKDLLFEMYTQIETYLKSATAFIYAL